MILRRIFLLALLPAFAHVTPVFAQGDSLDAFVTGQMARRQIPGLSLAIIDDGRIVEVRAYGTTARGGTERVTPETLFQAGSISKPITALGALRLVEAGTLSLDEDVNRRLRNWKVPDNEYTRAEPVTLRRLLNHTAGVTGASYGGYPPGARIPSAIDVLEGRGNTPAVRVDVVPGSRVRYSGGGYMVVQQLMTDATGLAFATYMQDSVLRPMGMVNSTYEQPLPDGLHARAARGAHLNRVDVDGGWRTHPEQAVAGLWTTATDLARYAIDVQDAVAGKPARISREMASQMLTLPPNGSHGLGPGVGGAPGNLQFSHGGRNEGFDATLIAYAESGDGVAIMINANDNSGMMSRIVDYVAKKYEWPSTPPPVPAIQPVQVAPAELAAVAGQYALQNGRMLTLMARDGRIYTVVNELPDEEFVATSPDRFASPERAMSFRVVKNEIGDVEALEWTTSTATVRLPRL